MEITLGSEVILKTRLTITWTVSCIEGNKIYCYRAGHDQQISSIVADVAMLIPVEPVKATRKPVE